MPVAILLDADFQASKNGSIRAAPIEVAVKPKVFIHAEASRSKVFRKWKTVMHKTSPITHLLSFHR